MRPDETTHYNYLNSMNEFWNNGVRMLVKAFYTGRWDPSFENEQITNIVGTPPADLYQASTGGQEGGKFETASPQLVNYVNKYLQVLLTYKDAQGNRLYDISNARKIVGAPPDDQTGFAAGRGELIGNLVKAFVEEGDAGLARYAVNLGKSGEMDKALNYLNDITSYRLRAQQAASMRVQDQQAQQRLALEVAKYSSELAAAPHNWIQHAAFLRNIGAPINGLSLGMSAQLVPPERLTQYGMSDTAGMIRNEEEVERRAATGETGSTASETITPTPVVSRAQPVGAQPQRQQPTGTLASAWQQGRDMVSGLSGRPEYTALQQMAQQQADTLRTTPTVGPANALGVNVGEVRGGEVHYPTLLDFTPGEVAQKKSLVESARGANTWGDFLAEADRARPKGQARAGLAFG